MLAFLVRMLRAESGAAAIDYGLVATLIGVAGVSVMRAVGISLVNVF